MIEIALRKLRCFTEPERRGRADQPQTAPCILEDLPLPSAVCAHFKANTGLKVISMVRPRGAGFCYTEAETEQMFADARILMENGSEWAWPLDFSNFDGKLHSETGRMIELIHEFHGEAVFHRALTV